MKSILVQPKGRFFELSALAVKATPRDILVFLFLKSYGRLLHLSNVQRAEIAVKFAKS